MCTCDCGRQQQCISDRSICFKAINREILHMEIYNHLEKSITSVYPFKTGPNELDVFRTSFGRLELLCPTRDPGKYRCKYPHLWKGIIFKKLPFEGLLVGAMFCSSDVPWKCWKLTSKPCYPSHSHSHQPSLPRPVPCIQGACTPSTCTCEKWEKLSEVLFLCVV